MKGSRRILESNIQDLATLYQSDLLLHEDYGRNHSKSRSVMLLELGVDISEVP